MKKVKISIYTFFGLLLIFYIVSFLSFKVDVSINPITNKEVGMYTLNEKVFNFFTNDNAKIFDFLSDVIRIVAYGFLMIYVITGFIQLVTRKDLKKVDQKILALGVMVLTAIALKYIFDYVLVLGYRPILEDGKLKASYPSSHIFITTFIMLSLNIMIYEKFNSKKFSIIVGVVSSILIICQFFFRLLASMHWLTDCIAGLLLGLILTNILYILIQYINRKQKNLSAK